MNVELDPIITLKSISRILDTLTYECSGRQYTLNDDQMSWIFYCRDLADDCIRKELQKGKK